MPTLLWILLALVVVFAAAALATRPGAELAPVESDRADVVLPEGRTQEADVRRLRFGLVLRGYRMAEVDRVLGRLAAELGDRDRELDELRAAISAGVPDVSAPSSPTDVTEAHPEAEVVPAGPSPEPPLPVADASDEPATPQEITPQETSPQVEAEPVRRSSSAFDVADWSMPAVEPGGPDEPSDLSSSAADERR